MKQISILILVLAGDTKISNRNLAAQENTWMKKLPKGVRVIKYSGGSKFSFDGKRLVVEVEDDYNSLSLKALESFKWISDNISFDYIFRTNTSSYVDTSQLVNFCKENKDEYIYRGRRIQNTFNGSVIEWASGAEILMSKQTFKILMENSADWNTNLVDDVSIGKILQEKKITLQSSGSLLFDKSFFKIKDFNHEYHFRCRVDSPYYYPRFIEKYLINYIHKNLYNKNISFLRRVFYKTIFSLSTIFAFKKHREYFRHYFWMLLKKFLSANLKPNN